MKIRPHPRATAAMTAIVAIVVLTAAADVLPAAATPPASEPPATAKSAVEDNDPPKLSLPVACRLGETCFIQSYVDLDPGPGARDYRCGSATYDGHKGVDFRLASAAAAHEGVAVRAAADGIVKRLRDGMEDVFVTAATRAGVTKRGCGNSAVVDHGGGWQTIYCHMRKGSLAVRPGDAVSRGQRIGDVGYSGLAEFAHLHLMVMRNGVVIDPASGLRVGDACATSDAGATLWDATAAKSFSYRNGEFIGAGFSARQIGTRELEIDHRVVPPNAVSKALLFYARLTNLRANDRISMSVTGPDGFVVKHVSEPLNRNKATYVTFAGRRLRAPRWPAGNYEGKAELIRGGEVIARSDTKLLTLP